MTLFSTCLDIVVFLIMIAKNACNRHEVAKEGFEDKGGEGKWDKTETPEGLKFKTHFFPAFTFCQCL